MKYTITGADTAAKEIWQEKSIYILAGGFKLDTTNLPSTLLTLPKGALLKIVHSTKIAYLVKSAEVYEALNAGGTTLKVKKTHTFNALEYIAAGKKSVQISTIDTSNALYDSFALGAALDATEVIALGTALYQAGSATTDLAVSSTATVVDNPAKIASSVILTDDTAETLTVGIPAGTNNLTVTINANGSDALAVSYASNVLLIRLATTTASKNTGALIQAAIRTKTDADGYDFSTFTAVASATWDSAATGNALTVPTGSTQGGLVQGTAADTLTITNPEGVNGLKVVVTANSSDALSVSYASHILSIALAMTTATKNTAALIQAAIRALAVADGYNFKRFTVASAGTWDSAAIGTYLHSATVYFVNGAVGSDVTPTSLPNAINYIDATIETYSAVTALGRAYEIKEANMPYPVTAAYKEALGDNFTWI